MDIVLYFNISAICLSLTVLIAYILRGKNPQRDYYALFVLICTVFMSNVLEFMFAVSHTILNNNRTLNLILLSVYFLSRFLCVVLCVTYMVYTTETTSIVNTHWNAILALFAVGGIALIVGSTKFGWMFYFDEQNQYHRGQYILLYYLVVMIFYLFCMMILLRFGNSINYTKRIAMIALMIFPVLAVAVQFLYPDINVEGFAFSIGLLWIFLAMPKNAYLYDSVLNVLNQYAFDSKVNIALENDAEFMLIILSIRNKSFILEQNGMEYYHGMLQNVIGFFRKYVKSNELFYLGDGRFAVFTYQMDEHKNEKIANKVIKKMKKEIPLSADDAEVKVSCALLEAGQDVSSLNDVYNYFEYLDVNGSVTEGKVNLGDEIDISHVKRAEKIESAIDRALQKTSFEVYYQPIYSVEEKRFIAAEALLRMKDDDLGIVSPEEFIPIAEKNGTIIKIGELVLRSICEFLTQVPIQDLGIRYIEVNLSAVECMEHSLPEKIEAILDKYHIDKKFINLEVTETALADDTKILADNMYKLRKKGITFSLDDYGTGYSNINYILNLPFGIVKIDKTLLWQCVDNEKAIIALKSSMNMIHDMGMEIVVEGVENEEMVEIIKQMPCDYLQGYYFSKPMKDEDFIWFLSNTMGRVNENSKMI